MIVEQEIKLRMKKYEQVAHEFNKFFNQETLSQLLDTKIDQSQLLQETNTKVSKEAF